MTTLYKPRKPGLMDRQIKAAKSARHISADGYEVLNRLEKATGFSAAVLLGVDVLTPNFPDRSRSAHSYTEHGDFTHCAGRGL